MVPKFLKYLAPPVLLIPPSQIPFEPPYDGRTKKLGLLQYKEKDATISADSDALHSDTVSVEQAVTSQTPSYQHLSSSVHAIDRNLSFRVSLCGQQTDTDENSTAKSNNIQDPYCDRIISLTSRTRFAIWCLLNWVSEP